MAESRTRSGDGNEIGEIIAALEVQVVKMDGIGLTIPAAHVDLAIHQLRAEQVNPTTR